MYPSLTSEGAGPERQIRAVLLLDGHLFLPFPVSNLTLLGWRLSVGRRVGYTRVSSLDQDPDRKLDGVVLNRTSPKGSWRKRRPPAAGSDAQLRPLSTVTQFLIRSVTPFFVPVSWTVKTSDIGLLSVAHLGGRYW